MNELVLLRERTGRDVLDQYFGYPMAQIWRSSADRRPAIGHARTMGPLAGVRVVELSGIGPLPMC